MKKLFICIICFVSMFAKAQNEAASTHYLLNPTSINPAYTGFSDKYQLFLNARWAWQGFTDAPRTYLLSFNAPIGNTLGLGVMVGKESLAQLQQIRGQLSYAFRYQISDVKMALGISTEFRQLSINSQAANPLFDQNDDTYKDYLAGSRIFDAGVGFSGNYKDKLLFGLSAPNLISARLGSVNINSGDKSSFLNAGLATLGYKFDVNEITVVPSILMGKSRTVPFVADFNLRTSFANEAATVGLTYHAGLWKAVSLMLGAKMNGLFIGYTYDYSFQAFQNYNGGSHEITIGFEFAKKENKFEKKKRYRN